MSSLIKRMFRATNDDSTDGRPQEVKRRDAFSPGGSENNKRSVSISDAETAPDSSRHKNNTAAAPPPTATATSGGGGRSPPLPPLRTSFAPVPPLPARKGLANNRSSSGNQQNLSRTRSLSRVFNSLPGNLPTVTDMCTDMLEFQLHVILLQTDWKKLCGCEKTLDPWLERLGAEAQNGVTGKPRSWQELFPHRGRCYTRMQLSALAMDITRLRIEDDGEDDKDRRVGGIGEGERGSATDNYDEESLRRMVPCSLSVSPADWIRIKENWNTVKTLMLRKDANELVPWTEVRGTLPADDRMKTAQKDCVSTIIDDDPTGNSNEMLDEKLEEHDMFQEEYHAIGRLLVVQQVLSLLRDALLNGVRHHSTLTKEHISQIIQQVEGEWRESEYGDPEEGGLPVEPFQAIMAPLRVVRDRSRVDANGVKKAMMDTLRRYKEVVLAPEDKDEDYSHVVLQSKMRALLTMWSEKLLDTPELFRTQYRGVTAPLEENGALKDNDDISSLGGDMNDTAERDKEMAEMMAAAEGQQEEQKQEAEDDDLFETQPLEDEARRAQQRAQFVAEKRPLLKSRESTEQQQRRTPPAASAAPKADASSSKRKGRREKDKKRKKPPPPSSSRAATGRSPRQEGQLETPNARSTRRPPPASRSSSGGVDENVAPRGERKRELEDTTSEEEVVEGARPPPRARPRKRQKRVPFTEDEADAIRDGVKRFGVGHWKTIKQHDRRLRNRDTVQIKDKYRNMLKKNEV